MKLIYGSGVPAGVAPSAGFLTVRIVGEGLGFGGGGGASVASGVGCADWFALRLPRRLLFSFPNSPLTFAGTVDLFASWTAGVAAGVGFAITTG